MIEGRFAQFRHGHPPFQTFHPVDQNGRFTAPRNNIEFMPARPAPCCHRPFANPDGVRIMLLPAQVQPGIGGRGTGLVAMGTIHIQIGARCSSGWLILPCFPYWQECGDLRHPVQLSAGHLLRQPVSRQVAGLWPDRNDSAVQPVTFLALFLLGTR